MLTKLEIRNFKRFDSVEVELGNPVVFVGPNNSGKTTALQALALWDLGIRRWHEKHGKNQAPAKRPGVVINRRDFLPAAIPAANLLWRDLHVRDVRKENGTQKTSNIRIDVTLSGVSTSGEWRCGFEFDYADAESFHCRPVRTSEGKNPDRMPVPEEAKEVRMAFLPPMSGLSDREFKKEPGEIAFLIGQGRTAEVLRNLCYQVRRLDDGEAWRTVLDRIERLFGIRLNDPELLQDRAEITMTYREKSGVVLDLSSSGRGAQQTLLLLTYMASNPQTVLLLDEPDAHMEILRQRQIYDELSSVAKQRGNQIIIASHSEVLLNEAADRDVVVAFVGKPHRIDDRGAQVLKALKEIGFDHYYQAEQQGWVLYVEGATDLAILRAFAAKLEHPAASELERPFVHYIGNDPQAARRHFFGLCEAKPDLVGFVLCDRLDRALQSTPSLTERMWRRREIENYLCQPRTLMAYVASLAQEQSGGPLFEQAAVESFSLAMDATIRDSVPPAAYREPSGKWWRDIKATDDFLDPVFERFFQSVALPNIMRKSDYHELAAHVSREDLDPEITGILDEILQVSRRSKPVS